MAVMGCAVNGPGEAKEADIGIAGGIGEGLLIKKGNNGHIREKLFPDLPFHPEHILFMNQMLGGDINAQKILPPGARLRWRHRWRRWCRTFPWISRWLSWAAR